MCAWARPEKFQGPLTIIAAFPASNWPVAAGVWGQPEPALDAEPSVTSCFHRLRACPPGADATLKKLNAPPLLQKNGSHRQVVSSAASLVNAVPKCCGVPMSRTEPGFSYD